jgi:epsilon-lactone hydrolase
MNDELSVVRNVRDRFHVPKSIESPTAEALEWYYSIIRGLPAPKKPECLADYDAAHAAAEAGMEPVNQHVVEQYQSSFAEDTIGGVAVLRARSAAHDPALTPLVYIHGGGWVSFSAWSTRGQAARAAAATGREVISIDYTRAPRGNYRSITAEVLAVWAGLLAEGYDPASMGMFGDSAGGNLVAASTLLMRDRGMPLPGALLLLSPATDLTWTGDSVYTLADVDPGLDSRTLSWMTEAYVGSDDPRHPYVSPVFGDFRQSYPPTLIQVGTREILLSDSVRLYQAIKSGGHEAVLDVYEGMPHVFQAFLYAAPETDVAWHRAADFLNSRLSGYQSGRQSCQA